MLPAGTTLGGRYTIKSLVGSGGMGTVYCALDERLGRTVALKVLRDDLAADAVARTRFLREGQIAAQIVHPNVVRTYDAAADAAAAYLIQELLTGDTLDHLLPLPPTRAAAVLRGVAAGLDAIHHQGYVHCDVKPQNILLCADGRPVLLDFGIARAVGTATTTLLATPLYLAPERAQGASPTAAADQYALGIVLFETIAGYPPFQGASMQDIIQQHIALPVPPLPLQDPVGRVLDRIIARLTAKEPAERYAAPERLRLDLAAVEHHAIDAQPTVAVVPAAAAPPRPAAASVSLVPQTSPAGRAARVLAGPALSTIEQAVGVAADHVGRWATRAAGVAHLAWLTVRHAGVGRAHAVRRGWSRAPTQQGRRWLAALLGAALLLMLGVGLSYTHRDHTGSAPPLVGVPVPSSALTTTAPAVTTVAVPDVVGLQYAAAAQLLQTAGLVTLFGEQRVDASAPGTVLQSDPAATGLVAPGTTVVLYTSSGPGESVAPLPAQPWPALPRLPVRGKGRGHGHR
ncbi:MAG: hypothetical protein NVSMB42_07990 [Herpetosiphon sp.]